MVIFESVALSLSGCRSLIESSGSGDIVSDDSDLVCLHCSSVENVLLAGEQWHLTLGRISVLHRLFLVTRRNIIELTALGAVFAL